MADRCSQLGANLLALVSRAYVFQSLLAALRQLDAIDVLPLAFWGIVLYFSTDLVPLLYHPCVIELNAEHWDHLGNRSAIPGKRWPDDF